MLFPIIPSSVFFHFVSFPTFGKSRVEFCPSFTTRSLYLQPGQRVGVSCAKIIFTSNIFCLTLDNEQKSIGFDKRITWIYLFYLALFWSYRRFCKNHKKFFRISSIFVLFFSFFSSLPLLEDTIQRNL